MSEVDIRYTYYKIQCSECGKRILVELLVEANEEGNVPNMDVQCICAECLKSKGLDPDFVNNYPEIAQDMSKWINALEEEEDETEG